MLVLGVVALSGACGQSRVDEIAAVGETKTAAPAPAKAPAVEHDPGPLDRMLVGTPTFLWSADEQVVACTGSTRKGDDVTFRFELFGADGKRVADPVELVSGAREFAAKRKPIDARLAKGFAPLQRVAWPGDARELAIPGTDAVLHWQEHGQLAIARGKAKPVVVHTLSRADMIPVAVHLGPAAEVAAIEAKFDPEDKTAVDAQHTECAVMRLAAPG